MVSQPSYNNTSYAPVNRRASQQLNRIGSKQARPPSAGLGPIRLPAGQALFEADGTDGVHYTYCRFSHDVTKIQTTKLLILLIFYFNEV